ncbi:cation diffusion facilitator family transporter [Microbulbifer donghaiensis]|uniref:Cation diffusion facilitator family transporter n=1 Tax=Microbulbifer donghaiensis TaxID=494016 RepID=A0A1M5ALK0_9GAMM|nr:cation diffusion facilitator family transporter [Microbulbifer donghaiensis]SHF31045.1 cation diffusion facilitator family transporter [Microbulbifer donghaiensis]
METRGLFTSIFGCLAMAALGFTFAFLTHSNAIFLDGVFSLVNFVMSLLMLAVSRLIKRNADNKFPFGYASFEPAFNVLQSMVMLGVMLMALSSAIAALYGDGRSLETGIATIYAIVACTGCLLVYLLLRRIARATGSPLIEVDAFAWLMDGILSGVVLCAFAFAWQFGELLGGWLPYVDSLLVIAMVAVMLPVPVRILYRNLMEVLLAAPAIPVQRSIRRAFRDAMHDIPGRDWSLSITKTGRAVYLHARILLPEDSRNASVEQADAWRELLTERMAEFVREREFDVVFTTDASYI